MMLIAGCFLIWIPGVNASKIGKLSTSPFLDRTLFFFMYLIIILFMLGEYA